MKRFRVMVAITLIATIGISSVACNPGGDEELSNLILLLVILELTKEKKKEEACSVLSPAAGASSDSADMPISLMDGPVNEGYFDTPWGRRKYPYQEWNGAFIVQGDMLFRSLAQDPQGGGGLQNSSTIDGNNWTSRTIPYSNASADATKVAQAIAHWERHSEFRFSQTGSGNRLNFVDPGDGTTCNSFVGNTGSVQTINLASGCSVGNAVHEIGHALGLFHEQSRQDRDSHVDIDTTNICCGAAGNYDKETTGVDVGSYDFNSIMHYGSYFFALDTSKPVMTKKNGDIISPQRDALTNCDVNGAHATNPL